MMGMVRPVLALIAGLTLLSATASAQTPASTASDLMPALRAEAFEAAQQAMASEAADALAKVSARFARGDDAIAALAEQRETLALRRDRLEREIERLYGVPGEDGARLRRESHTAYQAILTALNEADAQIAERFPAYAELTRPGALTVAQTQGLLRPDEGLLLILVNEGAAYVWAVSTDDIAWARADNLGAEAMAETVSRLRASLGVTAGRSRPYAPTGRTDPAAFDTVAAHGLYRDLIAPVEGVFAGRSTLIVVTGGDLSSVPPAILPTRPSPGADGWLIDRYALATLPSVSSLMTLRCHRETDPALRAAVCPADQAPAPTRASANPITLAGFGAPLLDGAAVPAGRGSVDAASIFIESDLADVDQLRALPALPGSLLELQALGQLYPSSLIRTGAQATETAVRRTDAQVLSQARFVVFSTHGLLAGSDQAEPGLVLTPPVAASPDDDGYLSASEAAQLRLSAEFVVLSACNTAGASGQPGGEGLSGLARAFFYAGARSLLVSHWEVSDAATTRLITGAFTALDAGDRGGDPGARARALRAAMLQVRADPRWSHPAFWGGFTLVGAPG
jgi:CHAT domain-containing protein